MHRFALRIEYNGAGFVGWQRQPGFATVQGAIEAALARLEPGPHAITGAGRTDTGVHALGQVAHADLARDWTPFRLMEALNFHLKPALIAVSACARVGEEFHARFSALERRYTYRILCRRAPPVLAFGQVWHVRHELDIAAMAEAARALVGWHDFTTFRSSTCQAKSPKKTLDECRVEAVAAPAGTEIHLHLRARSFLHNQVRSIAGTLVRVGCGGWAPGRVAAALAARDRAACGPVAPPQGLCLMGVRYAADPFGGA